MELRVLNYFLIAAREENITKAAALSGEIIIGCGENQSMRFLAKRMNH